LGEEVNKEKDNYDEGIGEGWNDDDEWLDVE
jgi:hypothetical protein